ncbi:acyclic terpene utilization AtuA family protein [Aspergillus mulundensis]|uniref:DUF1446-domain-containing protein n=1 Tax=Aspergillus mulundensis TaxID=1810919 RepID=A0A3D8QV39_9EURO|nr:Uncharacterized protein DSM5745_09376 [Aspergillus mulundensis]RDW65637.1 Uncharacterized protein DSM5745_09376 [Aspergillus mulundensis]
MGSTSPRPVRVGGASGGFSDRVQAITQLAQHGECDIIVGDWLSEMTMTVHGAGKARNKASAASKPLSLEERVKTAMFAENFIDCFEPAIPHLYNNKVKLAVNAGASDTEILAELVQKMCEDAGCPMKVAWVEGDDVTDAVQELVAQGEQFESLVHGRKLEEWGFEPVCAQAYMGGLGIAEALRQGADIVICGRVADASPAIGAAAWWHGWAADQFDELAGSLVAGHLIECASYVCGGYYSAFKDILKAGKHLNVGFPIAHIDHRGETLLTKEANTGGVITVGSVTSQLVYEIQGPLYYNSDVTAQLEGIRMEQVGEDQVRITGVKGLPPPPTAKVGITAPAGYQAEYHVYLVGLDIEEKAKFTEDQIKEALGPERLAKFSLLKFHVNGSSPIDARNQDLATVDFRIFAQSPDRELLRMTNPDGFFRRSMVTFLEGVPGASLGNDMRQAEGKPYYRYWPALIPQTALRQRVHNLYDNRVTDIPAPKITREYPRQQKSYETTNPVDLSTFGETVRAPLGYIVLGRGGDKASDCNNGFFVRHDDEWDWLRSFLTIDKIIELLGPEEYKGKPIDRFEIPALRTVHFLLKDHMQGEYNCCSSYDTLGKNCMEYLRAKTVDLPKRFLERGRV